MILLMNARVMPRAGQYYLTALTREEFARSVRSAHAAGLLRSYIGYPETADLLSRLTEIPIPLCRETADLQDGDQMLIASLAYRVNDPKAKGKQVVHIKDFEFFHADYREI